MYQVTGLERQWLRRAAILASDAVSSLLYIEADGVKRRLIMLTFTNLLSCAQHSKWFTCLTHSIITAIRSCSSAVISLLSQMRKLRLTKIDSCIWLVELGFRWTSESNTSLPGGGMPLGPVDPDGGEGVWWECCRGGGCGQRGYNQWVFMPKAFSQVTGMNQWPNSVSQFSC